MIYFSFEALSGVVPSIVMYICFPRNGSFEMRARLFLRSRALVESSEG